MNYDQLKNKAEKLFPVILLEKFISHKFRHQVRTALFIIMVIYFLLLIFEIRFENVDVHTFFSSYLLEHSFIIRNLFFIFFSLWIIFYLFEAMYLSFFFKNKEIDIEIAKIIINTENKDITNGFFNSEIGKYVLIRLGISKRDFDIFLKNRKYHVTKGEYTILENDNDPYISLFEYGSTLYHFDPDLRDFLQERDINIQIFKGVMKWISDSQREIREIERWWSKEKLNCIPTIGRNWSRGMIGILAKYSKNIYEDRFYNKLRGEIGINLKHSDQLQNELIKFGAPNIMVLSQDDELTSNVIYHIAENIIRGISDPHLEAKRIYILDWKKIVNQNKNISKIENDFRKIMHNAHSAKDIILIINQFDKLYEKLNNFGTEILEVFKEAIDSTNVQILAVIDNEEYEKAVALDIDLKKNFTIMKFEKINDEDLIKMVQRQVNIVESSNKLIFTYQSILKIVEELKKMEKFVLNDAIKLINKISKNAEEKKLKIILPEIVDHKTS